FFFQAEDGIRDKLVTGVQTCALPIYFEAAGVTPRRTLTEIRTNDSAEYSLGQELTVDTFEAGQKVDVVGTSKGKGFAGVMKRHKIGRASCRERVCVSGGAAGVNGCGG